MSAELSQMPNSTAPRHLSVGLLPWESEDEFLALYVAYLDRYAPQGPAETGLVEQLVWLDWRRRRLRLGERALHMASLWRSAGAGYNDQLTDRAASHLNIAGSERSSSNALQSDDEDDAKSVVEWEEMLASAEAAQERIHRAIMDDGGQEAFEEALALLPEETLEWYTETTEEEGSRFAFDAAGLQLFLVLEVLPFFRKSLTGYHIGPNVRLQAWGESLDPDRMDNLLALDERLDRQYGRTLGQLIQLQKLRLTTV